jgi:hypothetical protein
MSGDEEHDKLLGPLEQTSEPYATPADGGDRVWRVVLVAASVVSGLGLLAAFAEISPGFLERLFPHGIPGYYYVCSREDFTRAKIRTIETAVEDYKDRHGDYPASLGDLTVSEEGKAPYLDEDCLIDYWSTPIRYDPQDRHPATGRPKVFSVTPKRAVISNW